MHLMWYLLVSALFLIGSMADMCFQCAQTVKNEEKIAPASCAGGSFDHNKLPPGVTVKDCGNIGCLKAVAVVDLFGYKGYTRNCGNPKYNGNKCIDMASYVSDLTKDNSKGEVCLCHGDYCNGAAGMNNRQAIFGIIASVITFIVVYY